MVDVLDAQHRRLAELFEDVSKPGEDRPAVLHRLLKELAAHVAAERAEVEPVVKRRSIGGDGLAGDLVGDYSRIENLMVLIERRKFNSPDVPDLVSDLKDALDAHIARCDETLLPALGSTLSGAECAEMGEKVANADSMVTTHPHPHLLSLRGLSAKVTALLARFDWARDKTVTNLPAASDEGDPSMGGTT